MPSYILLPYCVLAVALVVALFRVVRSGLDKRLPLSQTSRGIRVIGGGLWLAMILGGIIARIVESINSR